MRTSFPLGYALALVFLGAPLTSSAQQTGSTVRDPGLPAGGWLVGGSVGLMRFDGVFATEQPTLGFNATHVRPGRLGFDFAIATAPRYVAEGVGIFGLRGGVALPLALSRRVLVVPSVGATMFGAISGGDIEGESGLNVGLASVLFASSRLGLRTGITWHVFNELDQAVGLWEVGLVRGPRFH